MKTHQLTDSFHIATNIKKLKLHIKITDTLIVYDLTWFDEVQWGLCWLACHNNILTAFAQLTFLRVKSVICNAEYEKANKQAYNIVGGEKGFLILFIFRLDSRRVKYIF